MDVSHGRPPVDDDLLTKAFALAARLHRSDLRKGTAVPYLAHPMAVAALVLEHGGTDEQAAAALLHDVVEDHGGLARLEEISADISPVVADIVRDCSDSFVAEGAAKAPWRERKEEYLRHLASASAASLLVSCADKVHNARAIVTDARATGPALWDRFHASPPDLAWYYRSLADIFTACLTTEPAASLARTLDATVAELEAEAANAGSERGVIRPGSAPATRR